MVRRGSELESVRPAMPADNDVRINSERVCARHGLSCGRIASPSPPVRTPVFKRLNARHDARRGGGGRI